VLEILNLTGAVSFSTAGTFDYMIGTFLSQVFFLITGLDLPDGYIEIFSSTAPGIIADRGVLGLLLGTIIITASQVNRAWIPGVYLAVYILLVRIFGALPFGGPLGNGDIFFSLFSGGTIVVAFLLASDPVTGPKSNGGVFLISMLGGALTYIFRYQAMEPYSGFLVIAVLNTIVPLIRNCESQNLYETRRNAA
jgi:electron transport complex protein RnfD